jgi:hypothetical protein
MTLYLCILYCFYQARLHCQLKYVLKWRGLVNGVQQSTMHCKRKIMLEQTNLLTPWSRVFPKKPTRPQTVKKSSVFYGTRRFITAFTTVRHMSLPEQELSNTCPHPTSRRSILILSFHLRLGLPSGLLLSGSYQNKFYFS